MQEFESYLTNANHPELLIELRRLLQRYDQLTEKFKWNMPVYTINNKDVCYLKDTKNGVNFGFTGAKILEDTTGILEGTGKDMRHIKVTPTNLRDHRSAIKTILENAIDNAENP